MNKKHKGFTLVELVVTIAIIIVVLGISVYGITKIISNSKEKSIEVTLNNIKASAVDYVNENINGVNWVNSGEASENVEDTEFTCVSILALVNYGYYSKTILDNKNINSNGYIKINRGITSKAIINEEISEDSDIKCAPYYIQVPNCNDNTYDGSDKTLINDPDSKYQVTYTEDNNKEFNNFETDAGDYELTLLLIQDTDFSWSDGSITNKTITCKIKPKPITIKINSISLLMSEFYNNEYIGDKGKIKNQLTVNGLIDGHEISDFKVTKNNEGTKLYISDVKITTSEGTDVTSNYKIPEKVSGELTLINNLIDIPTASICKNPTYNGNEQILATAPKNVTLSNNSGTDAGSYTVTASINDEYVWSDGTKTSKTITCSIGKAATTSITLSNKTTSYTGSNINFANSDVTIKGVNNETVKDSNAKYTFTYYSDSSCKTTITTYKNVGTYYGNVTVSNLSNYNDGTSNCAKLSITNKSVLTYNPNGGTVNPTSKEIETGKSYGTLPTPTRTGYTFNGWYTAASGGTKIESSTKVTNTNNHTIYAHWTAKKVEVTFHKNGGSTSVFKQTFTYGVSGNKFYYNNDGTPKGAQTGQFGQWDRTGYTLLGWSTTSTATSKTYNVYSGVSNNWIDTNSPSIDLYAVWAPKTITVTFMRNTSTSDTAKTTATYTYGVSGQSFSSATTAVGWTKTGYSALGWATSKTATTQNYSWKAVVSDSWINTNSPSITLYAVWKDNINPTCSVSKSNTYTTSGVTTKVTCSDSGSGCKTGTQTYTGVKSSKTYTVEDKAGNKGTCTVSISSRKRYRTAKRCSSAGCSTWNSYTNSTCYGSGASSATYCSSVAKSKTDNKTVKYRCVDMQGCSAGYKSFLQRATCKTYKQSGSTCGWNSWGSSSCTVTSNKCESKTEYY